MKTYICGNSDVGTLKGDFELVDLFWSAGASAVPSRERQVRDGIVHVVYELRNFNQLCRSTRLT